MTLLDTNLLVYAYEISFPEHEKTRAWLELRLQEPSRVGIPWSSLLGFLRLVTNPRIFRQPASLQTAWAQVEAWLSAPGAWIPEPGERHRQILGVLLAGEGMTSKLVPDAHLAALAIEYDLTLCSADQDFARFPGLRWLNPLTSTSLPGA